MTQGIETFFIRYANYPLRENPEHLREIFDEAVSYLSMSPEIHSSAKVAIELLLRFAECDDFEEASRYKERLKSARKKPQSRYLNVTLESTFGYVFGYKEGYCEGICPFSPVKKIDAIGKRHFTGPRRFKCYECEQLYLAYILSKIVEGQEFSEIIGFESYINQARNTVKRGVMIDAALPTSAFKESLKRTPMWDSPLIVLSIGHFLGGVISYSLGELLLNDDRRLLKRCPYCHEFFRADRINQERCKSDECRKAYERSKKRKQREADPVKYY